MAYFAPLAGVGLTNNPPRDTLFVLPAPNRSLSYAAYSCRFVSCSMV